MYLYVRGIDFTYSRAPELIPFAWWGRAAPHFIFLCCPVMCLYVLSSVLGCLLRFPYKNDVQVVFASSCFYESACPIYVICVCFRIVVSNAYCVAFLILFLVLFFWFSSFYVPCVASFSGLSFFDCTFDTL
jgi:hypothetical protein